MGDSFPPSWNEAVPSFICKHLGLVPSPEPSTLIHPHLTSSSEFIYLQTPLPVSDEALPYSTAITFCWWQSQTTGPDNFQLLEASARVTNSPEAALRTWMASSHQQTLVVTEEIALATVHLSLAFPIISTFHLTSAP